MKLFEPRVTVAGDVTSRALTTADVFSDPYGTRGFGLLGQKPAPSLLLQALLPAGVALPCGLVRKLKVEGDN
jgi:hypothetical protein